jgi:hypothetical protein
VTSQTELPDWFARLLADRCWDGTRHRFVGVEHSTRDHYKIIVAWCECGWQSNKIVASDEKTSSAVAAQAHNAHAKQARQRN